MILTKHEYTHDVYKNSKNIGENLSKDINIKGVKI